MKDFTGKVAVITGAASGIGRGLAERAAREGMRLVLADVEEQALATVARELETAGAPVLVVRTDVSQLPEVEALARKAMDAYGSVHLVCNNAGVGIPRKAVWEATMDDWRWVFGVNFWGVVHGVRTFVPLMLAQNNDCHVVNTASIAGLTSTVGMGVYQATKHAVVTLSETLYQELQERKAKIGVSVLCPGGVLTRISSAERNRPQAYRDPNAPPGAYAPRPVPQRRDMMPPEEVASHVFEAVRAGRLYILTHPARTPLIRERMEAIIEGRNPSSRTL